MMELREAQRAGKESLQGRAARIGVLRVWTNRFAAFRGVSMLLRGRIALVILCLPGATLASPTDCAGTSPDGRARCVAPNLSPMSYGYCSTTQLTVAQTFESNCYKAVVGEGNQITSESQLTAFLGCLVAPNTYDLRQRLLSTSVAGQTTSYEYDPAGQLLKVTSSDASWIGYEYDAAHRQTAIKDNLGNRIEYALDNAGNKTGQCVKDPQGNLARSRARSIDALGRVQQTTGRE